jgi:hypothetical protein
MARSPELIIGYDGCSFPTSAVCSACGESMTLCKYPIPTSYESIIWFKVQFDKHLLQWHAVPDASSTQ